ncbi:MAG TPA: hypothetical protein VEC37_04695, partial [Bacillota bacterium]|nr:hypothetical protein [Bacillota bacterium]
MNTPLSILKYYLLNHRRINVVLAITFFSVLLQYALLVYVTTMVNLELKTPLELLKLVSVIELTKPTREKRNLIIM